MTVPNQPITGRVAQTGGVRRREASSVGHSFAQRDYSRPRGDRTVVSGAGITVVRPGAIFNSANTFVFRMLPYLDFDALEQHGVRQDRPYRTSHVDEGLSLCLRPAY